MWCLQTAQRERERQAGNPLLPSSRNSRGLFKESYSQNVRCVVKHNMRASEGGWAATQLHPDGFNILSWFQLFSSLFEKNKTKKKHTAAVALIAKRKKEVKGRCSVEAMKAIRRELLPPVQQRFMTSRCSGGARLSKINL